MTVNFEVVNKDCLVWLKQNTTTKFDLTFIDPPFNQGKEYRHTDDDLPTDTYWNWITDVLREIHAHTSLGGSIYFMQREKNAEYVLKSLRATGWFFQNLIIWKKKTSAVPGMNKFGKHFQIIVFATKGDRPRVFNKLRISPPLPSGYKFERENGMYVTDVWDDIRELTSGYFAGDEAIRAKNGERFHKQQSPISLLLRIVLSSTKVGDTVFDPFAGTGTTLIVANQLQRNAIGLEVDFMNIECIKNRMENIRDADMINKYYKDYSCTENLDEIWGHPQLPQSSRRKTRQTTLFN